MKKKIHSLKVFLIDEHSCANYLGKIYNVCYRIRQEHTKFTVSLKKKTMLKYKSILNSCQNYVDPDQIDCY